MAIICGSEGDKGFILRDYSRFLTNKKDSLCVRILAGVEGLEPPTPGFGDQCSSHLSYTPIATILSRISFVANVKIVKNKNS
jgi:hypothetical protein